MGVVYWLQAARWRRIADTRAGSALRRDGRRRRRGQQRAARRVGDLLRARWVSRGAFSGGRGLATVVLDRGFDLLPWSSSCSPTLPLVTDEAWVDRIVVGSVLVAARAPRHPRRPLVHAAAAARAPRAHRGLPRRFAATRSRGSPIRSPSSAASSRRAEPRRLGGMGGAAMLIGRAVGVELSLVEAIFVTAALNLGVAIPSSPGFVGTYQWLGVSASRSSASRRKQGSRSPS